MYPGIVALVGEEAAPSIVVIDSANIATHVQTTASNAWTFAMNLAADVNKALVLCTYQNANAATGATYGGNACSLITDEVQSNRRTSAFYIDAASLPALGANNVVISYPQNVVGHAVAIPLKVAAQGAPAFASAPVDDGTSVNDSVTVAAGGAVFKSTCIDGLHVADVTEGASEDIIYEDEETVATVNLTAQFTSKDNQSGSVSMSTSWTGVEDAALIVVGVDP